MTNEELESAIITVMVFDGWRKILNQKSRYLRPHVFNIVCPMTLHKSDILEHTRYHTSRDWLHPVWEKFRLTKVSLLNDKDAYQFEVHSRKIRLCITDGSPLEAFTALHSAIVWFNEINKEGWC